MEENPEILGAIFSPTFLPLLKNLRGIVYLPPEGDVLAALQWLANKFRYRNIGVCRSVYESYPEGEPAGDLIRKKPFVLVDFPWEHLRDFAQSLQPAGVPLRAIESLLIAACYVSPLILPFPQAFEEFAPFEAWSLQSTFPSTDQERKRHLRIADYGVLDLYRDIIDALIDLSPSGKESPLRLEEKLSQQVEHRSKVAQRDGEKRFWRLAAQGDVPPRKLVAYLDPLKGLLGLSPSHKQSALDLLQKNWKQIIPGLSIEVAFCLEV